MDTIPIQDQLANISPVWVVGIVACLTMVRVALARSRGTWTQIISETCDTLNFVLILAFLLIRPFVAQAFYIPSESMESTLLVRDRLIVNKFLYRFSDPQRTDVLVFEAPPQATGDKKGVDFIKRLIGMPGEKIQVTSAKLIVGGEEIDPHIEAAHLHDYLRFKLDLSPNAAVKIFPDYILVDGKEKITREQIAERLGRPGEPVTLVPGQVLINGKPLDEPYTREDPDYDYPGNGMSLELGPNEYFMMGDNRNHSSDSHAWGPLEKQRVVGKAVFIFWPPSRLGIIK